MLLRFFVLLFVLTSLPALAAPAEIPDPLDHWLRNDTEGASAGGAIIRIKGDFNNDRREDAMFGSSALMGNAGGSFGIYFGLAGGKYADGGSLFLSPEGFRLVPVSMRIAKILGCSHMSAEQCKPFGYILKSNNISAIPEDELPGMFGPQDKDTHDYKEFTTYSKIPFETCDAENFKKTGTCDWKEGWSAYKHSDTIKLINIDATGKVQISLQSGKQVTPPMESEQVSSKNPKISGDGQTAGWLAEFPNCCTSYPVATTLVIYRDNKVINRFTMGQHITGWQFLNSGVHLAFCADVLHGESRASCRKVDTTTGKMTEEWNFSDPKMPEWAQIH